MQNWSKLDAFRASAQVRELGLEEMRTSTGGLFSKCPDGTRPCTDNRAACCCYDPGCSCC